MKISLLLFLFFNLTNCFSQNIKGKVTVNNLPIQNVEVINISFKEVVNTNTEGIFEIKATTGNWITFYHKNYDVVRVYVDSLFDYTKSLEIQLTEKSIQIEEVAINNGLGFGKIDFDKLEINNDKSNVRFSDGTIPNGMNFTAIFKKIKKAIEKNKEKISIKEPVDFMNFTSQSYTNDYLVDNLKLKPEEIDEFLNFCNFDPKSRKAVENSDPLTLLQFLMIKSEEFKSLHQKG